MSDMPNKIAAWRFIPEKADEWIHGGWSEDHDHKTTSYIPEALAQAMVAAAYEDASDIIAQAWTGQTSQFLRTRAPTDARAALDAMVAKAREEREMFAWAMEAVAKAREDGERAGLSTALKLAQENRNRRGEAVENAILDAIARTAEGKA